MAEVDHTPQFGMALARMNLPLINVGDFLDVPQFTAAEVPVECFDSGMDGTAARIKQAQFKILHCGGVLDRELSRYMPQADAKIRQEFLLQTERVLCRLAEHGVHTAALECGMNSVLCNADASAHVLELLRKLSPLLLSLRTTLLLPFRIPSQTDADPETMSAFLRNSMIPGIKVRLDVHPHELPHDFTVKEAAGYLLYETASVIFVYNADSGNRLIPEHVLPWVQALDRIGMRGPFLTAPHSRNQRMSMPECDSFANFVSCLRNR